MRRSQRRSSARSAKAATPLVSMHGALVDTFNFSLERYSKDIEIVQLVEQQQLDYKISLTGKIPVYEVKVPATLTKEKYY
jgi:hypothetical protein